MNYERILDKKNRYEAGKNKIDEVTLTSYDKDFELTFTHNSTAIEGNTLTLMETKVLLEDGISIGGKELREIYEVVIHEILTAGIIQGGIYRNQEVRISGAGHVPPAGNDMYFQIKNFFTDLQYKQGMNPIELAAWTHAEFVRIHPFIDGNGRTSRLIMNYQLMIHGFLPVSIAKEDRLNYYNALEEYAVNGNLDLFVDLIADLEETQLDTYIKLIRE